MRKIDLCGMTTDEIHEFIKADEYTLTHAVTVAIGIYRKQIKNIIEIPLIPKKLQSLLDNNFNCGVFPPETFKVSTDGSVKYLFRTSQGKVFETVFIPDGKRNTVCVSTQSGCRMGCPFCVTAQYGFHGNLTAGEIVNQIISLPDSKKITHVVFMGMGEPMDNLSEVLKACEIITAQWGIAISPANITVSTVGITPSVVTFLEESNCNLTLSLYSPFEIERIVVIPSEKKYPAHEILQIMRNFPIKKKRRLSVAYVMMQDVNDSENHLSELTSLLAGSKIRVNLLPYNSGISDTVTSSTDARMQYFKHNLVTRGISASIRKSRGADISAACGLLASGIY
jgi:23S rRNA (adenine2503-C2)-methyltransferase